jgi:cyclic-di-GMP-binding protein
VPTFDVVSEVDLQEVRNAVDQAQREVTTRFDFKDTGSTVELGDGEIRMHSSTSDGLKALVQVLEEKLVRREVPLKAMSYGEVEDAAKGTVRQTVKLSVGISDVKARELNRFIKDLKIKGASSQAQGDQVRVQSKKRDDLQAVIAALKGEDFGIPLQFKNFRD